MSYPRVSAKWLMCYYLVFVKYIGHTKRDITVQLSVIKVNVLLPCLCEVYWPNKTRYNCSVKCYQSKCVTTLLFVKYIGHTKRDNSSVKCHKIITIMFFKVN